MRSPVRLLLAVATLLAACSGSTDPNGFARVELARHRSQWQAAALHSYDFDYQFSAMIASPAPQPVRISVRADTVARVVSVPTGDEVTLVFPWPTIDVLFDRAAQALASPDDRPTITYDAQLGYPTSINALSRVPDAGWSATATNLAPAP